MKPTMTADNLHTIHETLRRDYTDRPGGGYRINHIITHGGSYVVLFTRTYESTLGTRSIVTEHRSAVFRFIGDEFITKASDMITD